MAKKVLIGNSNLAEYELLNDLFSAKGFVVSWLRNGQDVVARFDNIQPHLMILDALLPGMTGLKVTQAIRTRGRCKDTKIVLMSSVYKQFQAQYESRKKIGVDAYTEKPVNVAELEKLIDDLVGPALDDGESLASSQASAQASLLYETADKIRKVGLEGRLSDVPFPKLLFYLLKFQRTGALRLDHEQMEKVIYFRSGAPVFISSNQSQESFGRFLAQKKIITQAQYNASLEQMLETKRQHGEVLLEMGAVTPHQVFRALQEHLRDRILSVFTWESGRYHFSAGDFDVDKDIVMDINPVRLIHHGITRFYPLSRLEGFFNDYKNQGVTKKKKPVISLEEIGLGPAVMKFVSLINNKRTIGQLVARSKLSLTETFQVLYLLILLERIRFKIDPSFGARGEMAQRQFMKQKKRAREGMRRVAESGGAGSARLARYVREVGEAYKRFKNQNHYERLGVEPKATTEEIKQAYYVLCVKYHEHDLYESADPATQKKADKIFLALSRAYSKLTQTDTRRYYDGRLKEAEAEPEEAAELEAAETPEETPAAESEALEEEFASIQDQAAMEAISASARELSVEPSDAAPRADDAEEGIPEPGVLSESDDEDLGSLWDAEEELSGKAAEDAGEPQPGDTDALLTESKEITSDLATQLQAELIFQAGEEALREGDCEKAIHSFRKAVEMAPREAEYYGYLGLAVFRASPEDAQAVVEARKMIEKGLTMNPALDTSHGFLGLIANDLGDRELARTHMEKALKFNSENEAALKFFAED